MAPKQEKGKLEDLGSLEKTCVLFFSCAKTNAATDGTRVRFIKTRPSESTHHVKSFAFYSSTVLHLSHFQYSRWRSRCNHNNFLKIGGYTTIPLEKAMIFFSFVA